MVTLGKYFQNIGETKYMLPLKPYSNLGLTCPLGNVEVYLDVEGG